VHRIDVHVNLRFYASTPWHSLTESIILFENQNRTIVLFYYSEGE